MLLVLCFFETPRETYVVLIQLISPCRLAFFKHFAIPSESANDVKTDEDDVEIPFDGGVHFPAFLSIFPSSLTVIEQDSIAQTAAI